MIDFINSKLPLMLWKEAIKQEQLFWCWVQVRNFISLHSRDMILILPSFE